MTRRALVAVVGVGIAGAAFGQTNVPAGLHNVSENWTLAGSPYRLKGQVYFTGGATLTIDAGVIVASLPADQGSLAICRDAQIFVNGEQDKPVIMTSTDDVATWSGTVGAGAAQIPGDSRTGSFRQSALEWGNLTIMGNAYISENAPALGNNPIPAASNQADMEGLNNGPTTDRYGGGNDDDDRGSVRYLSLRYGGKVIGLANELNGLSLGGIGRETQVDFIDVMCNIDDGVEVWGGTVNLKHLNIWNIGDDSLDIDQGWRGKAQFGLLVQGWSLKAGANWQGSGCGDNLFETDGAEDSWWQPVTTTTIYNYTAIGLPNTVDPVNNSSGGDHATAWRANARVQYRNCIFMDIGERVVSFDNSDGDVPLADSGYGANGSLSWAATWTTAVGATPAYPLSDPNPPIAGFYGAQKAGGRLAEITDSVFFRNQHTTAYTEANLRNVFDPANNNVQIASILDADSPIQSLTRAPGIVQAGLNVARVATLDPRPKNQALTSVAAAPTNNGFFQPAKYRGAFAPGAQAWICGWTAASAFGFVQGCGPGFSFCFGDGKISPCPCVLPNTVPNPGSAPEHGCANGFNLDGALLTAAGSTTPAPGTISFDVLVSASPNPNFVSFALMVKGNGQLPNGVANADGLRCADGQLIRFGGHNGSTNGAALGHWTYPNTVQTTPVKTQTAQPNGQTAYYQLFYRSVNPPNFCTPALANWSNAYQIFWP
jgi:hypothetical protein